MAEQIHRRWLAADPGRALVTVRPGVVFGPGEGGNYTHLAGALRRGLFAYPGRKTTIKSGGYVDELIATLDFALGRATAGKERDVLYNFAYPALSTTEEIVATFGRVAGFSTGYVTLPVWPLLLAAWPFELLNSLGVNTPIHRERVLKLVQSTRIQPAWLQARGYEFASNLEAALTLWRDETKGAFV
jgi:nucleoside-diphosphate-sugar epimerase